ASGRGVVDGVGTAVGGNASMAGSVGASVGGTAGVGASVVGATGVGLFEPAAGVGEAGPAGAAVGASIGRGVSPGFAAAELLAFDVGDAETRGVFVARAAGAAPLGRTVGVAIAVAPAGAPAAI